MIKKVEEMKKAKPFYYSTAWRKCRASILSRDNHLCQPCLKKGILTPATTVHHIKPLDDYPELALDADNLESCCRQCHEEHHPSHGFIQYKKQIIAVLGPDNTKWVKAMAQECDVILDQGAIAKATHSQEIAEDMVRNIVRNIRGKGYTYNIMYIVKQQLSEEEQQLLRAARAKVYWVGEDSKERPERAKHIPPLPKA